MCLWAREKEWTMRVLCLDGAGLSGLYVCLSVGERTMPMYGGGVSAVRTERLSEYPSASITVEINNRPPYQTRLEQRAARQSTLVLFSSEKISDFGTIAFSFLFDKYYPIID